VRHAISDDALDQLFRAARTQNKWLDKPVSQTLLHALYELMRMGPTSANCSPARVMMAARAVGLDCGPMSGFDNAGVDAAFFAGTKVKSNFICGLGYGDPTGVFPRSPRLTFDEACQII
jgi:nitroreductase